MMTEEERFVCKKCDPPTDITEQVIAERDEQMVILRTVKQRGSRWTVSTTCPNGHDCSFTGTWT